MKNFIKIIIFQIGVDCLGFPKFHIHTLKSKEKMYQNFIK